MTDLESRLREALHDEVGGRPVDVLLGDVRRGARRRRTRRTTSVAAVAALVVAGAVGFTATRHHETTPLPSHRPTTVAPSRIEDLSVSASGERFKAVRNDGCASPCTAVWSQRGDAPWARTGEIKDLTTGVTMAPDGQNGWAPGQTGVWSTHDGGHTWARVRTFAAPSTRGVGIMTGPDVAWAMLPGPQRARLWRSPVGSEDWVRVRLPKLPPQAQMQNVLPDSRVVLGVLGVVKNSVQRVVVGDGTTWHRYGIPCYPVPELLGGQPSTRGEACGFARVAGTPEGGSLASAGQALPTGSRVDLGMVTTPGHPVGPVRSLYVSGDRAVVYSPDGREQAHIALAGHETIQQLATSGDHAVLSTSLGHVFASDDGGLTWSRVP